jgi:hypothetical protein
VLIVSEEDMEQMLAKADEVIYKQTEKMRKKQEARAGIHSMLVCLSYIFFSYSLFI